MKNSYYIMRIGPRPKIRLLRENHFCSVLPEESQCISHNIGSERSPQNLSFDSAMRETTERWCPLERFNELTL